MISVVDSTLSGVNASVDIGDAGGSVKRKLFVKFQDAGSRGMHQPRVCRVLICAMQSVMRRKMSLERRSQM